MDQNLKTIFDFIQQNENLTADEKTTFSKAVKDVDKELTITTFKLDRTEKVKRTTAILLEETIEELEQKRKAVEMQNRELEIEAALEKVRSSSLAMQNSGQIREIVKVVFEKLKELKFAIDGGVFVGTISNNSDYINFWIGDDHAEYPGSFKIPNYDAPTISDVWNARKSGVEFISKTYSFKEKNIWFEYAFNHTDFKNALPEDFKKWILEQECLTQSFAMQKNSMIGVHFHHAKTLTENEIDILKRFSRVFEQSYVRFLDLQKAEAQARESQIQLALERVRARTMAMQKSEELKDVVKVMNRQFDSLAVAEWGCSIMIFDKKANRIENWVAESTNSDLSCYIIEGQLHPVYKRLWKHWEQQAPTITLHHADEVKREFDNFWLYETDYKRLPDEVKSTVLNEREIFLTYSSMHHGLISVAGYKQLSEDQISILDRFSKVFEQTYTRFLDLQKAEAQAREAQIEASLERVRSRSMAMHKSNELREVVNTLHNEFRSLDINFNVAIIQLLKGDPRDLYLWVGTADGLYDNLIYWPYVDIRLRNFMHQIRLAKKLFFEIVLTQAETKEFFEEYFKIEGTPQGRKTATASVELIDIMGFYQANTGIFLMRYTKGVYSEDEKKITERFAKVFEQTYTRFLDLQKAEAQAREAQIEAALERLRARSIGMHKSDELIQVVRILDKAISGLGIEASGTQIITDFANPEDGLNDWYAREGQAYLEKFHVPYLEHPLTKKLYNALQNGVDFYTENYSKTEKNKYFRLLFKYSDFRKTSKERQEFVFHSPAYIRAVAVSKNSTLIFQRFDLNEFTKEEEGIFKRFGKVFEQAYTRFLDLQKAETQAREAQIEASLERVRSKAMAMHSSDDLAATITVFYHEMVSLSTGSIIRCGAGLLSKENQIADLSTVSRTTEGEIAEVRGKLDMSGHSMLQNVYDHWLLMREYHHVLRGNEIKAYYQYARKQIEIPDYPDDVVQFAYFPMFSEGSFYVFTENELTEEELQVYRRFTSVLSLTYKRYNDLKHAEAQAREAQIEAALERVRSRSLAMKQSHELQEVISAVFVQMQNLGIKADASLINILSDESKDFYLWIGTIGQTYAQKIRIPYIKHPVFDVFYEARDRGETFMTNALTRAEKDSFFEYAFKYSDLKLMPDDRKKYVMDSAGFARSFAWSKNSGITIQNYAGIPYSDQENNILKRFAHVFEQAYTRFLDVQKAEAQAREAIKQASLDRVRGEIASMRNKEDLNRITPLVWKELNALGISFIRCGVLIMDESREVIQTFLSTPEGKSLTAFEMSFNEKGIGTGASEHWAKNEIYTDFWDKNQFITFMQNLIKQGKIDNPKSFQGDYNPPEELYLNFVPFKQGMLYVGNTSPLASHELNLVQSLAKTFAIAFARYEDFKQLEAAKNEIETTLSELKSTQSQLIQSEKMASLGELTAGIAHEIQNPLNFVNNFSEVSAELIDEMKEELEESSKQYAAGSRQSGEEKLNLAMEIASDISQNLKKINHHGNRASSIVKGMLLHSRTSTGQMEQTDINALADEYLRLAYHGLRAKDKSFNADFKTEFDESLPKINIIPQDIGRVLLNLINNAFYAVTAQAPPPPEGGIKNSQTDYKPTVTVRTASWNPPSGGRGALISVSDNGPGIPTNIIDKIFQPFFTTKPTGQGTGLGLSLSYDIVKAHGGELKVETKEGEGSVFTITLKL